ncbi:MAG: shikimate dehydrogenase [Flavobacteriales bacterium]|nr:shikimate dehydrogenase [Flavobacteriales bacterium]
MATYGLIGKSLSHSFSKTYFSDWFLKEGLPHTYQNFELEAISELNHKVLDLKDLVGFNVTNPYKGAIIDYCQLLSPAAKEIGAVNCVKRVGDQLHGHNTDWMGFTQSLRNWTGKKKPKSALVLGDGGASKAVQYALKHLGIDFFVISRKQKGRTSFANLDEDLVKENLLVVNTTPLGTSPNLLEKPPFPYSFLSARHLLYDLVYNPENTAYMQEGLNRGCQVKNGIEMLEIQAQESWRIWSN